MKYWRMMMKSNEEIKININDPESLGYVADSWWEATPNPNHWIKKFNFWVELDFRGKKKEYYKLVEKSKCNCSSASDERLDPSNFTLTNFLDLYGPVLSSCLVPRALFELAGEVKNCKACKWNRNDKCVLKKNGTWLPSFPFNKPKECFEFDWSRGLEIVVNEFSDAEDFDEFLKQEVEE